MEKKRMNLEENKTKIYKEKTKRKYTNRKQSKEQKKK